MIATHILLALETKTEIRIFALLLSSKEPMRLKDIYVPLKLHKTRCSNALERIRNRTGRSCFFYILRV